MKRVLIIDDDENVLDNLEESFNERNISVIRCNDRAEALRSVNNDVPFDAVILDWYFVLSYDSAISKEILRSLNKRHFKPVFVYTGHLTDFENTSAEEIEFPGNLITAYDKTINADELNRRIQQLLSEKYSLQIASVYRDCIKEQFEKVLFELNELQNVDLARVLNKIYGDGSNIDWSNDIILNLLHRSLISDSTFTSGITDILQAASHVNQGASAEDRKKIANKILYYNAKSDFIRNGDIIVINRLNSMEIFGFGIVITPDCDLEQSGSRYIDVIELVKFDDGRLALNADSQRKIKQYNHDSFYLFQSLLIDGNLHDYVAVLKSRIILKEVTNVYHLNYPKASKRLLYSQEFLCNGEKVILKLLCSKVNPYKAEFLQKLHSSISRVGIPDIKGLL